MADSKTTLRPEDRVKYSPIHPASVSCANTVLRVRRSKETKVVVPTTIQRTCPQKIQLRNAKISSTLYGRTDLIENHLKRIDSRCQKPVAAASNSSFVGRWR